MKPSLSVIFFIDLLESPERFISLLELATSLIQAGVTPHILALAPAEQAQNLQSLSANWSTHLSTPVPVTFLSSQPCHFGPDEWARQRMQELVDFWSTQKTETLGSLCAPWSGIYHAQDVISASALTLLQDLGFIEQFLFTLQESPQIDQSYLAQWYKRSLQAAKQCFCISLQQQELLKMQFDVAAQLIPLKKRSRIQQRRCWERQITPPSGAQQSLWQELARQHLECYEQTFEGGGWDAASDFLHSA